jgi:hypothetical protein
VTAAQTARGVLVVAALVATLRLQERQTSVVAGVDVEAQQRLAHQEVRVL